MTAWVAGFDGSSSPVREFSEFPESLGFSGLGSFGGYGSGGSVPEGSGGGEWAFGRSAIGCRIPAER